MGTMSSAPPLDPELAAALAIIAEQMPPMTRENLPLMRQYSTTEATKDQLVGMGLVCTDSVISGYDGAEVVVTVIRSEDHRGRGPGIYHTHGGGMVAGQRMDGILQLAPWLLEYDAVAVTAEYRLAPEFPDPVPVEDCYAGLLWTAAHADELGIDTGRLLVAGTSAGGGLAAAMSLLARDRGGPQLIGQLLMCPMIDDRDATVSSAQYDGVAGAWDRTTNRMAWECLLGDRRGTDEVSIYAAPARATDLSKLPPAFIDCGSAEVFRDEDVEYASRLWAAGVQAELHVWPGGFHGFDLLAPHAAVSRAAVEARNAWIARLLSA